MMIPVRTLIACGVATTGLVLAALPVMALPVAPNGADPAFVKVSGWATRAEGRRHTYPQGYGYGYEGYYGSGSRGWAGYGAPDAYGYGYSRAAPPVYEDDDGFGEF